MERKSYKQYSVDVQWLPKMGYPTLQNYILMARDAAEAESIALSMAAVQFPQSSSMNVQGMRLVDGIAEVF